MSCMEIPYRPFANQTIQKKNSSMQGFQTSIGGNNKVPTSFLFSSSRGKGQNLSQTNLTSSALEKNEKCEALNLKNKRYSASAFVSFKNSLSATTDLEVSSQESEHSNGQLKSSLNVTNQKNFDSNSKSCQARRSHNDINFVRNGNNLLSSIANKRTLPDLSMEKPAKKRINSRCIMLKYFDGSPSDEVDQHFYKALNRDVFLKKDLNLPMSKRKFPASFWDSTYQHHSFSNFPSSSSYPLSLPFSATCSSLSAFMQINPLTRIKNDVRLPFSSQEINFLSKLHLYQHSSSALSSMQDRFDSVYPQSSSNFSSPWKSYAQFSCSLTGQKLLSDRAMSAATLAAVSSIPNLLGNSAASRFNFLARRPEGFGKRNLVNTIVSSEDLRSTYIKESQIWSRTNIVG